MIRSGAWKLMYYAEFDDYLLFNLDEDPGETRDRARDPDTRQVATTLLDKARARWSPEAMLEGDQRERARRETLPDNPASTTPLDTEYPPEEANSFDFSQLPDWEELVRRRGTDER